MHFAVDRDLEFARHTGRPNRAITVDEVNAAPERGAPGTQGCSKWLRLFFHAISKLRRGINTQIEALRIEGHRRSQRLIEVVPRHAAIRWNTQIGCEQRGKGDDRRCPRVLAARPSSAASRAHHHHVPSAADCRRVGRSARRGRRPGRAHTRHDRQRVTRVRRVSPRSATAWPGRFRTLGVWGPFRGPHLARYFCLRRDSRRLRDGVSRPRSARRPRSRA